MSTTVADKVVYESKTPQRKPGSRVRYVDRGITHRKVKAAWWWRTQVMVAGEWHELLNECLPGNGETLATPVSESICLRCGHAYSALLLSREAVCDECRLDAIAERAMLAQYLYGIDLGWHDRDPIHLREKHGVRVKDIVTAPLSW